MIMKPSTNDPQVCNKHHTVKKVPRNQTGRDFVVGDVHGAFDTLKGAMRHAHFDTTKDRLFVVGDLVDRGPGSERVLEFLAQPYVHAIRGNHDDDIANLGLDELKLLGSVNWNGMGWISDVSDDRLLAIKDALSRLPIAMEVDTSRGRVGLVHAEVPIGMDWHTFTTRLEAGDVDCINSALTGRDRLQRQNASGVAGIDRLFVGHTIQWDGVHQLGNVYAIDTGAVFREISKEMGALTMANLICHTSALANHRADPANVIAGDDEIPEAPFGQYGSHP